MPRDCIWNCGRPADSNEDVLAEWIREYLGAKTGRKKWELRDLTPIDSLVTTTKNPRPGPRRGFRVRADKIVCQDCNNEWMSDLQNAAKPTLLSMFEGGSLTLAPSAQAALLSWSTMTAICNHYASREEVDASRRNYFYKYRSPPPYTEVLMTYIPEPKLDTMHAAAGWRDRLGKRPRAYIDVFGIRQLALLILQGSLPQAVREALNRVGRRAVTLTPTPDLSSYLTWPPDPLTTEGFSDLFEAVAMALIPR